MAVSEPVEGLGAAVGAGLVVGAAVCAALVPWTVTRARRWGIIDEPGARSSHTVATPRLGGFGVAAGAVVGAGVGLGVLAAISAGSAVRVVGVGAVVAAAVAFGVVGAVDDLRRGVPVSARLAAQGCLGVVAAMALVAVGDAGLATVGGVLGWVVAAVGIVGFVNACNFMDGVDGITGFVAIVAGIDLVAVGVVAGEPSLALLGAPLIGAAAGFLVFNLRPATVFLGDGGSYLIGAWLAASMVLGIVLGVAPVALLAVAVPYVADTGATLVRRVRRGADWRASHHEHTYQQLVERGWSHRSVAGLVAGCCALCAALGGLAAVVPPAPGVVLVAAVLAVGGGYVALPGRLRRRTR